MPKLLAENFSEWGGDKRPGFWPRPLIGQKPPGVEGALRALRDQLPYQDVAVRALKDKLPYQGNRSPFREVR